MGNNKKHRYAIIYFEDHHYKIGIVSREKNFREEWETSGFWWLSGSSSMVGRYHDLEGVVTCNVSYAPATTSSGRRRLSDDAIRQSSALRAIAKRNRTK